MRHKHVDLIHAWAEGAEIEVRNTYGFWQDNPDPNWKETNEYRIKSKEPEWCENIPEHGILIKNNNDGAILKATRKNIPALAANCWIPLTNEEIERFKR